MPARTSCLLCGLACQTFTDQRQGDHAFTAWCFDRKIRKSMFSLFLNQFDQKFSPRICGLGVPKTITFHCFWTSLIRSSDLGYVDWGFPKTVTFDCWNSVDHTCASRPCSAECCLVINQVGGKQIKELENEIHKLEKLLQCYQFQIECRLVRIIP